MNVKEATDKAADFLKTFIPDAEKIQLEEVEITDDDKFWNITLSYENTDISNSYIVMGKSRKYKILKISTNNGDFRAMKIRDFK